MSACQLIAHRFRINDPEQDLLGRGGMGEVYRATDTQTGELVAVKALNSEIVTRDPDLVERFVREGEALHQLNHPNIVGMVAAVEEGGRHYLVMEYVGGGSLEDLLRKQSHLSSARTLEIALEVADALTRAHHLGIIHRDLKPANVLLAQDGTPRLADFGIAHVESDQRLTQTGVLMGTMDYLSPEVCQGMPPDERADIWAFGVMLFEMLTGRLPFGGDNLTAKLLAILTEPIPDLTQLAPDVPGALADLVYRMLDKDPQQRIPSVRLVGAELEAMLKGREPVTPSRVTPALSASAPKHNLPTQLSKFIGREKDIAQVKQLLSAARLVTLTGSGGAGKTRLSLQVAAEVLDDYKEGVWFVELAALTDPALILQTVAAVLDLREESGRPMMAVLADDLRAKTVLIILDNCEHLIEGCAQFVDAILRAAPHVKLFASSREPLSIGGEAIYRVPSLAVPDPQRLPPLEALTQYDAVRLFIERAKAAMTSFEVNDANAPAVAQLCYHLDGIPLAIELAAARVRGLKVEQIAQRLGDRFRLLTAGGRTALPHHQTLRALIDWSHSLLADQERSLFRRLSVFAGGWTIEAAEAICAGDGLESFDVLDVLLRLVDKSLVIMDEQSNETRYRMLETIREYAFDKLRDVGEIERIRNQHRDYFLAFAELANRQPPAERAQWHNRVESDHDNLRDALRWTLEQNESEFALRLCNALAAFWSVRGHWRESRRWYERAIVSSRQHQAITPVSQTYRAQYGTALDENGSTAYVQGDYVTAQEHLEEALAVKRELGDKAGVASVLHSLGGLAGYQGDYVTAQSIMEEALALHRDIGDKAGIAGKLWILALFAKERGDCDESQRLSQESLTYYRAVGSKNGAAWVLDNLACLAMLEGDYTRSQDLFGESLALRQEAENKFGLAWGMTNKGFLAWYQEDYKTARSLLKGGLASFQMMGVSSFNSARCLAGLANLDATEGHLQRATKLLSAIHTELVRTGTRITDIYRDAYDNALVIARAQLTEQEFSAAWAEGRALTIEQAIEYALKETSE